MPTRTIFGYQSLHRTLLESFLLFFIPLFIFLQISSGEAIFRLTHELDKMEAVNNVRERDEVNEQVRKEMEQKQKVYSPLSLFLSLFSFFLILSQAIQNTFREMHKALQGSLTELETVFYSSPYKDV
jgi:hypothetical protein